MSQRADSKVADVRFSSLELGGVDVITRIARSLFSYGQICQEILSYREARGSADLPTVPPTPKVLELAEQAVRTAMRGGYKNVFDGLADALVEIRREAVPLETIEMVGRVATAELRVRLAAAQ